MKVILFALTTIFAFSAQANDLQCFVSTSAMEELELPKNKMETPPGFPHLAGQSFFKQVTLKNNVSLEVSFQLRSKGGKQFDFRTFASDMSQMLHITANLDDSDMFQYTDRATGMAVLCTKN